MRLFYCQHCGKSFFPLSEYETHICVSMADTAPRLIIHKIELTQEQLDMIQKALDYYAVNTANAALIIHCERVSKFYENEATDAILLMQNIKDQTR